MSLKVVLGNIDRTSTEQAKPVKDSATLTSATSTPNNPVLQANSQQASQAAVNRAIQTSDAVVSTLRAFKGGSAKGGQGVKDVGQAEKLAEDVADKIRENPEEAKSAHDGLTSDRGAAALT